ncbi:iron response transcriptional regulator IrrA [Lutibaculum baratangense]|uniref:Ferric uptake regulation protein n=1 Tax=Lutibaculum baratangense AMV1 TaxID=631454 RepID=V4R1K0_9HYPH|nr:Fur family transcriptional regulator [Lutibaculum baratangense]ESR25857.1 Iron-responsive regulator Irr [Lutibaculum baratangense AMV1]
MTRPDHTDITTLLREAGLRPTRQRQALASLLFTGEDHHVSAEELHERAVRAQVPVSLATVYNTLHQFTRAGLLREVAVDGTKSYFDTDTSDHHHFYVEDDNHLMDIEGGQISVSGVPDAPDGMEVTFVDVVVRLRRSKDVPGARAPEAGEDD